MAKPDFLIIGAAKSGTTALYRYLQQHPQIFLSPVKEPHYFAFAGEKPDYRGPGVTVNKTSVTDLGAYQRLFDDVRDETAVGEASALYLYVPAAAARIKEYAPAMRLIVILRHPAERAFSSYLHLMRDGREPLMDFAAALQAEPQRIRANWGFLWRYRDLGFYAQQLRRYYALFPREQVRVYLYDDFRADALAVLRDMCRFIGVDDAFTPDMSLRHNVSGIPRQRWLHSLLHGAHPAKALLKPFLPVAWRDRARRQMTQRNLARPTLPPDLRRALTNDFRTEILDLQDLLQRDLSAWLFDGA